MPALHDMACSKCGTVELDAPIARAGKRCPCGGLIEILWQTNHQRDAAVHKSERAVLYYSPKEGKFQYPATNDKPVPERLRRRGYERVELSSLRALEQHGKQTGAISERAWFDKGSGRGLDDE